ncbi:MAG: aspartate aminotransferase family protein [Planctomycetes bacterium]|nr:aspartate aminotransferase family protein [Planctomycetota bacterium]
MDTSTTSSLYERARRVIPGGVCSATRLNRALGFPFFASRGEGSRVWDVEGREFVDMCCSHGAALLGHGHPAVGEAVRKAISLGTLCSFETEYHEALARKVCEVIPCAERVRFCSSGSEATLHLIRACRAYTGRDKIIRFEGNFHGYHELIYIGGAPPPPALARNRAHPYVESAGIPDQFAKLIIPIPYNDPEALRGAIADHGDEVALVILEPVVFNCACIKPQPGYLELLRELTQDAGIVLFYDEILSSFKKSIGGVQQDMGVTPDVCTIGKALGGGLPLSAFCGKAEIMDMYRPAGPVQHSGTFNAHLTAVLAGLAFLEEAQKPGFYSHLRELEAQLHAGINRIIEDHDLNMIVPHHGARFDILLGRREPALRYEDTFCHSKETLLKIIKACWQRGVYFHDYGGIPAHHGYSVQHTREDIEKVLSVLEDVLAPLKGQL